MKQNVPMQARTTFQTYRLIYVGRVTYNKFWFPWLKKVFNHSLIHSLTPWGRVYEKVWVTQLVQKFSALYGTELKGSLLCSQESTNSEALRNIL
jgi:hypothetical protein